MIFYWQIASCATRIAFLDKEKKLLTYLSRGIYNYFNDLVSIFLVIIPFVQLDINKGSESVSEIPNQEFVIGGGNDIKLF